MKYRIALLGKNNISVNILNILLEFKDEVEVVIVIPNNSDNGEDSWQKSLLKECIINAINWKKLDKINSVESIQLLTELKLDFLFSAQYDQIINQKVLDIPKFGAINIHFAPLPKYRGVSPIAWALFNGEKEFGVTIHYMDAGVDTGDIINQSIFAIERVRSARELYDLCTVKATELLKDTIKDILKLNNIRIPQDNSKALYYSKGSFDFKNCYINFNKDTKSLYNWIRAYIFPPFQYPKILLDGYEYDIIDASPDFRKNKFEKPGTIIVKDKNYLKIATHDSYINILIK